MNYATTVSKLEYKNDYYLCYYDYKKLFHYDYDNINRG